jgi:hypothetical protein
LLLRDPGGDSSGSDSGGAYARIGDTSSRKNQRNLSLRRWHRLAWAPKVNFPRIQTPDAPFICVEWPLLAIRSRGTRTMAADSSINETEAATGAADDKQPALREPSAGPPRPPRPAKRASGPVRIPLPNSAGLVSSSARAAAPPRAPSTPCPSHPWLRRLRRRTRPSRPRRRTQPSRPRHRNRCPQRFPRCPLRPRCPSLSPWYCPKIWRRTRAPTMSFRSRAPSHRVRPRCVSTAPDRILPSKRRALPSRRGAASPH